MVKLRTLLYAETYVYTENSMYSNLCLLIRSILGNSCIMTTFEDIHTTGLPGDIC